MNYINTVLESVRKRNANEPEFLQAVAGGSGVPGTRGGRPADPRKRAHP
jgi:hypothetical protein